MFIRNHAGFAVCGHVHDWVWHSRGSLRKFSEAWYPSTTRSKYGTIHVEHIVNLYSYARNTDHSLKKTRKDCGSLELWKFWCNVVNATADRDANGWSRLKIFAKRSLSRELSLLKPLISKSQQSYPCWNHVHFLSSFYAPLNEWRLWLAKIF